MARVVYVNGGATGNNNGTSWQHAYTDLQLALNDATLQSGDQIWVAQGTYRPTAGADRTATFALGAGVALYGGFDGTELTLSDRAWRANPTVLSGDIGMIGKCDDNSYHVVSIGTYSDPDSPRLDGFVVQGGNANGENHLNGGGLLILSNASAIIENCKITENRASVGAGLYVAGGGAAPPLLTLKNCEFRGNEAVRDGGGIMKFGVPMTVINSLFFENQAGGAGGAIFDDCGGLSLVSCTIVSNCAPDGGGGLLLYNAVPEDPIVNCVFWANRGDGMSVEQDQLKSPDGLPLVRHTCIEGCSTFCQNADDNNIGDNPQFVCLSDGDLRLTSASPCVDAGLNTAIGEPADLLGNPRKVDGNADQQIDVDMGAYEYQPTD